MDTTPADTTYITRANAQAHTQTHTHTNTHTHTHTAHSKSGEVIYRKRWREYRFS